MIQYSNYMRKLPPIQQSVVISSDSDSDSDYYSDSDPDSKSYSDSDWHLFTPICIRYLGYWRGTILKCFNQKPDS